MINESAIAVVQVGYHCKWNAGLLRTAFEVTKKWLADTPNDWWLGAEAPGVGRGYATYRGRARHVDATDFDKIAHIQVVRRAMDGHNQITDWVQFATFYRATRLFEIGSVPEIVGALTDRLGNDFQRLARMCSCAYGFLLRQPMRFGPIFYGGGGSLWIPDDPRNDETLTNHSWWGIEQLNARPSTEGLLRDIYTESYLSQPFLDARLGRTRTTLKEWIEADRAGRGALEPYTDILTKWTPPVEKIPQIREELFRAGRVYYSEFFRPPGRDGKPGLFYRPDLAAPWEAPDPIPEIYRADYWKDKDPSLTY